MCLPRLKLLVYRGHQGAAINAILYRTVLVNVPTNNQHISIICYRSQLDKRGAQTAVSRFNHFLLCTYCLGCACPVLGQLKKSLSLRPQRLCYCLLRYCPPLSVAQNNHVALDRRRRQACQADNNSFVLSLAHTRLASF